MDCAFCKNKENDERIIMEDDLSKSFLTNQPIVPGHVLVIPKRCVSKFDDLTEDEKDSIFNMMKNVKAALKKVFGSEGFNFAWNENIAAGQTVPHFHLHIVPRKKGDAGIYDYEPRKFLYRPGSRKTSKNEELLEIVDLLKNA